MTEVGYAAALVLAVLFAWAGTAKLADRRGSATFAALGLPGASVLGTALPVAEVALAAGLVLVPAIAAYAALALLAAFTTFLVRAVRRGVSVPCGCFGSASGLPIGAVDLVRNVLLAGAALVATFSDGPTVPGAGALVAAAVASAAGTCVILTGRRRAGGVVASGRRGSSPADVVIRRGRALP